MSYAKIYEYRFKNLQTIEIRRKTARGVNLVQNVGDVLCRGLGTEVPQWGPGAKPQYGFWGTKSPRS